MNCDRTCICSGASALCLQKHHGSEARRLYPLTSGISRSNCDRSGLVCPMCFKVWCCYVWINHQVDGGSDGQCQLQLVTPQPPHPTCPHSPFVWNPLFLPSIGGGLLMSVASNISHNNGALGFKSQWTQLNGRIVFKKKKKQCCW